MKTVGHKICRCNMVVAAQDENAVVWQGQRLHVRCAKALPEWKSKIERVWLAQRAERHHLANEAALRHFAERIARRDGVRLEEVFARLGTRQIEQQATA